jgi:WD40 repeat protein
MKRKLCLFSLAFLFLLSCLCRAQASEPPKEPVLRLETETHTSGIMKINVDHDGRYIATASTDKTARIWDTRTGKLLKVLRPPIGGDREGALFSVAFSPDGKTVACGGILGAEWKDRAIYLFDTATGKLVKRVSGTKEVVSALAYSPDGRYLAALQPAGYGLILFRTSDYRIIATDTRYSWRSRPPFNVDLHFSPVHGSDGSARLVTTSYDGHLRLYEITPGDSPALKLLEKVGTKGGNKPHGVKFSSDGSLVAVGFRDAAKVDVYSGRDLSYLYSPDSSDIKGGDLRTVAWSPDGELLWAAGGVHDIRLPNAVRRWTKGGKGPRVDTATEATPITDMVSLSEGRVAFGMYDGSFEVLDAHNKKVLSKQTALSFLGAILVSQDGTDVGFRFEQQDQAGGDVFSLRNRVLMSSSDRVERRELLRPVLSADRIKVTDSYQKNSPKINDTKITLSSFETSWWYAIAPKSEMVLHASSHFLRLLDKKAEEKWKVPLQGAPHGVNISGNEKVALVAEYDGAIHWFSMKDGKKLLSFFPHRDRKRWVIWSPHGYYDASENADELIGWHVNNGKDSEALFYPLARFFDKYYRPDVIAGVMETLEGDIKVVQELDRGGEKEPQGATSPPGHKALPARPHGETVITTEGIKPPPRVIIVSPQSGSRHDGREVALKVRAEDTGGGLDEIWLFHNGKRVAEEAGNVKMVTQGKVVEKTYAVSLTEGENYFAASAFNKERVESDPFEISVVLNGASTAPDLHLVLIGIDKYKNPALNLSYAGLDAKSLEDFFTSSPVRKLFKDVHVYKLLNEGATKKNIASLFENIKAKAQQKDAILIYMAGHGDIARKEWFFIPHELATPEEEDEVVKSGVSTTYITEVLKSFKSQKILVVIDACKSGGLVSGISGGIRGYEDRKVLKQLVRSTGTYVVSASTDKQYAAELKELGHGVFTYTMLEGLKSGAGDKKVTVEGLIQYIKNRLPELTEKYRGTPQWPVSWGAGMDFPLALY